MTIFSIARGYGITIEFADLGDWGCAELCSEYDASGPTIRINTRALQKRAPEELTGFLHFAVAHELYHHHEHRGRFAKLTGRRHRERAADAFARELMRSSE
ncbi:MAG: hypothetical protein M3160_00390 [Candidatus Eremiobacteraeota bacterium]|nr:hypothetical protein [Candidatus Eremiobacteraeota bacterium]